MPTMYKVVLGNPGGLGAWARYKNKILVLDFKTFAVEQRETLVFDPLALEKAIKSVLFFSTLAREESMETYRS